MTSVTRGSAFCLTIALLSAPEMLEAQTFTQWSSLPGGGRCEGLERTGSIALGDLDTDGDLDIVFGNGMHLAQTDWVFSNDGTGTFYGRRALGSDPDPSYGVVLGDLDGDGALDAVVANDRGWAPIYRNDGKGNFRFVTGLGSGTEPRRAVALGDLDRDGDLDIVLVGLGQDHIYLNDGRARRFTERALGSRQAGPSRATAVALADVDRDGDLDIIIPNRYEASSVIYVNDGNGGFAEMRRFGAGPEDTTSVAVGDIDRDGDIDIVAGNWEQPHIVYLNNGGGHFKEAGTFGAGNEQTWAVVLGDIDLDGDLDVVVGNVNVGFWSDDLDGDGSIDRAGRQYRDVPSRVYMNDGSGRFTSGSQISTGNDNTRPIALGDLDGDGDLDIVMGNDCQPNHIFFNPLRVPKSR